MLVRVDPLSGVPVYRQIMDQVKLQVASGVLAPGEELPSTRSLSSELGVNPMTVSKAYGLLEQEGILERRPGLPSVVARQPEDQICRRKEEQMLRALTPAVVVARQLGLSTEEALALFRRELDQTLDDEETIP